MGSRRSLGSLLACATAVSMLAVLISAGPVSAAAPGNDDRASATVVGGLPFRDRPDTSEATRQASDPDCFAEGNNHSVWYSFTPKRSGYYLARTAKPEYWATLTLSEVKAGGGLRILDCQDYGWNDLTWKARAGTTYLFMVGAAYGEPGGRVVFRVMRTPPPPTVSVVLTKRPRLTDTGWVRLQGEVRCTGVEYAELSAKARQYWGRFIIRAHGSKTVSCGSTWRMSLRGDLLKFGPGRVKVTVKAGACNIVGCDSDRIVRRVPLR